MGAGDFQGELQTGFDVSRFFPPDVVESLVRDPDGVVVRGNVRYWAERDPVPVEGIITCVFKVPGAGR